MYKNSIIDNLKYLNKNDLKRISSIINIIVIQRN